MLKFFMYLCLAVALILLVITIVLIINGIKKMNNNNRCPGIIVGFHKVTSSPFYDTTAVSPVISYNVDGKTYEFTGNYYSTGMKKGDNVTILYDKNDPSKATVKTGVYLGPIITGGLMAVFTIAFIIFAVLKSKNIINI